MLCCKGYVRDMVVKYGIQVVYEEAMYLEYYLVHFIALKMLAGSYIQYSLFESK